MGYFKSLGERKKLRDELHRQCMKACDLVISAALSNNTVPPSPVLLARWRTAITFGEHYRDHVQSMGWLEWLLYGRSVRQQSKVLINHASRAWYHFKNLSHR